LVEGALSGALRSYQALPSFIYPAVTGSAAERQIIFDALSRLPLKDISAINTIRMVPALGVPSSGGVALGVTRVATGDMQLSRWGNSFRTINGFAAASPQYMHTDSVNPDLLRNTVLHEAGHAHDYQGGFFHMLSPTSGHGPWGKGPFVTDYARTNAHEDFAESHAHYFESTKELQKVPGLEHSVTLRDADPAKFKAMRDSEQPTFMERLVDRQAFRETGRLIGDWTSGAPLARTGLAVLSAWSVMNLLSGGAGELANNLGKDEMQAVHGGLTLAAGVGLAFAFANPLLGPAALAALGARRGMEVADQSEDARAHTRSAATGAAVGGALGGLVGGVAGPLGGTCLGYAIGGPVGGAVGFLAGSLIGFRGGSTLGAEAGLALGRH
jgi:hypothetical protein